MEEVPQTVRREVKQNTLRFAACAGVCALLFLQGLRDLVRLAISTDVYSHVLVIPFISAALIYVERAKIFKPDTEKQKLVSGLLGLVSLFFYLLKIFARSNEASLLLALLSLLMLIWSAFSWFYGYPTFRAGLFPLALLLLALPPPRQVLDAFIFQLQAGSAAVTEWIFRLTGTPVVREGFVFALPGVAIEIAKECSGIRSTMALLITCLAAGYLLLRTPWARAALLLIAIPVMILKNGVRITTLSLLAIHVDHGFLFGRLHHEGGFLFFGLALGILLPVLWGLQRMEDKNSAPLSTLLLAKFNPFRTTRQGN